MEDRRLLAVVAMEDFDGGDTNLNSSTVPSGLFASGDAFGVGNLDSWPHGSGVPFSLTDDSTTDISGGGVFAGDTEGVFGAARAAAPLGANNFFGIADNDGFATNTATWEFDITGGSALELSIDMGGISNSSFDGYSTSTDVTFTYQIDAGPVRTAFDLDAVTAAFTTRPMDGGGASGGGRLLEVSGDNSVVKTLADTGGVAGDTYLDKTPASGSGAGLMDTFSTDITGTGTTLVLTLTADVPFEAMAFDNIVINDVSASGDSFSVAPLDAAKAEGSGGGTTPFTFQITRTGDTSTASSVDYRIVNPGAGVNSSDFFGANPTDMIAEGTEMFAAGQTTRTITLDVQRDSTAESTETFQVELFNPSVGSTVVGSPADATIVDDDTAAPSIVINEARLSSPGSSDDTSNFIELVDTSFASGTNLDEVTIVVLSSENNPGAIDYAFPLAGGSTDSNGYFLLANDGTSVSLDAGDLTDGTLDLFGSPSVIMAVKGFTGTVGIDLDATDDGVLDSTPWVSVIDAVALDDDESPDSDPDEFYISETGATIVGDGVNDNFVPSGVLRFPNGSGTFGQLPFGTQINDTPGEANGAVVLSVSEVVVEEESVANASSVTFDVTFLGTPSSTVTINAALADGSEATITSGSTLLFNTPGTQQITIDGISDSDVEGSEFDLINFTSTQGGSAEFDGLAIPSVDVTIVDDDVTWQLNEVRSQVASGDNLSNNFVEIVSMDGSDLVGNIAAAGLHLLVIDNTIGFAGQISQAVPLDGSSAGYLANSGGIGKSDAEGFLLIADDGNPGYSLNDGDIVVSDTVPGQGNNGFDLFSSQFGGATAILVSGFTGSLFDDLDVADDGTLDSMPWDSVLDSVTWKSVAGTNYLNYQDELGGDTVDGPGGSDFPPGGIAVRPDGSDMWEFTSAPAGTDPFQDPSFDTPGSTNAPKIVIGETFASTGAHEGGNTDTLDISLSIPPAAGDVTVTLTPDSQVDLGSGAGVPVVLTPFNVGNFSTVQTVTVTAFDDAISEGDHDGLITITTSAPMDADFDGLVIDPLTVNIADNDNASLPADIAINEIRLSTQNQTLDDASNNFFEAHSATVGADLTDLYLVVISESFNPGLIDFAIPLDGGSTDSDGIFLLTDSGNPAGYPFDIGVDLEAPANVIFDLFGSESSYAIVDGFTAQAGVDLDVDNDGIVDGGVAPWGTVYDDVTLSYVGGPALGEYFNFPATERVELPVGPFTPSGVRRVPDGTGPYGIMQFNDLGQDTPGESNELPPGIRIVDLSVDINPGLNTDLDLQEDPSSGADTFSIVLDAPPTAPTTIEVSDLLGQTDAIFTATGTSTFVFDSSNWFLQQEVQIDAIDDAVPEGDHTDVVRVTAIAGAAEYLALPAVDLTNVEIIDNDSAANAVVINEVNKDPFGFADTDLDGDANGDGIRSAFDDEFVELFNTGGSTVDISGWTIEDQVGVRHEVPANTLLSAGGYYVVFGGGTPTGSFGGAMVDIASTGGLGLSNNTDQVTLRDASMTAIAAVSWNVDDGIDDGVDNSLARLPNGSGSFEDQGNVDGFFTLFTPGVTNDGVATPTVLVSRTDGSNDVKEGGLIDTIDVALATNPSSPVDITLTPDAQLDLGAGAGNPITLSGITTTATSTVTISAVDDAIVEGGHLGLITFSVSQAAGSMEYDGLAVAPQSVNILDDVAEADFRINELRISADGPLDNTENFIEVVETGFGGGLGTNGLSLVILSGEFDPGLVDYVIPLNGGATDVNGFFALGQTGATNWTPEGTDLLLPSASFDPFGSPSTILLVNGSTVFQGQDLDPNDDGTLDLSGTEWDMVYDAVSLDDAESPEADIDFEYATQLGFSGQVIDDGVNDGLVPAGVARSTDVTGAFTALDFINLNSDTAGATNAAGDTTPPVVTDVRISGAWSPAFLAEVDPADSIGHSLPGPSQLRPLPWTNITTLTVDFSEDVLFSASDFSVVGVNTATYGISVTAGASASQVFITLSGGANFDTDKILLNIQDTVTDLSSNPLDGDWTDAVSTVSGDTVAGGDFNFRINVLEGDVTGDGATNIFDIFTVNGAQGNAPGNPGFNIFSDLDGNSVNIFDLFSVNAQQGATLPAGTPGLVPSPLPSPLAGESLTDLGDDDEEESGWADAVDSVFGGMQLLG